VAANEAGEAPVGAEDDGVRNEAGRRDALRAAHQAR
jgi:hypothetical protein